MAPFTEKGSCRWLVFDCRLPKESMCEPCNDHDQLSDRTLREMCEAGTAQKTGLCVRLHGSARERRQLLSAREAAPHGGRPKRSRSAPLIAIQHPPQPERQKSKRRKGRKTRDGEAFQRTIKDFREGKEVKSEVAVKRGILEALVGDSKLLTINSVGESKATKSRENKTAAAVLNGAAKLAVGLEKAGDYRDQMVSNAYRQEPTLNKTIASPVLAPAANIAANAEAAHAIARRHETEKLQKATQSLLASYATIVKNDFNTPRDRRPFLALFAVADGITRPRAEEMIGITINEREWKKARLHGRWPGVLKPSHKVPVFRQRVSTHQLQFLLHFLESPGNLQRYAFGSKLLHLAGKTSGSTTVEIDRVDRMKSVETLAVEYIVALDEEMNAAVDEDGEVDVDRCIDCEKLSQRRCRLKKDHKGNHSFTGKSSLSITTVRNLVKTLTGDDIKRLAGLDDTKVLKGRDNFERMRRMVEELCSDLVQSKAIRKSIDDAEVFYLTDFQNHLQRHGNQKCCCLTCGFCEEGIDRDGVACHARETHKNSCEKCAASFGIIEDIRTHFIAKVDALTGRGGSVLEIQQLEEVGIDIDRLVADLKEYRSHLARHKAEGDFDTEGINLLDDETALVISDFKMKILSCFFRENQLKFFGKRGVCCLGFMIVTNSADLEARAQGIKEVKFVMMISDDTTQDEHAIASAKHEIYTNHLPTGTKRVHFHSDGAGCFKAAMHKAFQPHWRQWTGIDETVNRITPAGGGKSALDGMFGRMNTCLGSAVDNGASHYDAKTTCEAMEASGGLSATTILHFNLRRNRRVYAGFDKKTNPPKLSSILRSVLNPDRSITVFKHSGYGIGRTAFPSQAAFSLKCKLKEAMVNQDKELVYARKDSSLLYKNKDFGATIQALTKLIFRQEKSLPLPPTTFQQERFDVVRGYLEYLHFQVNISPMLQDQCPFCLDVAEYHNKKKDVRSIMSQPGQGANHPNMRQEKREARIAVKARKDQVTVESIRAAKSAAGIFICPVRCHETFHYCRKEYLTERGLKEHIDKEREHDYPLGMSSTDKAIGMASKPGGILSIGSRTNRKATGMKSFPEAALGSKGSDAAESFQQFNRKEDTVAYVKPARLVAALEEIFDAYDPKLTGAQARVVIGKRVDPKDGGLMFSNAKRGTFPPKTGPHKKTYAAWAGCTACGQKPCDCNGALISSEQIDSFFSTLFQNQKKRGQLTKKQAEKAATEAALIANAEAGEAE